MEKKLGPSTRDAYGEVLVELGEENPGIVVLDADLSKSTKTAAFGEKFPEPVLTATPGKVGVYRVIRAKAGPFTGELALDLGFASYLSLEAFSSRRRPRDGARFFDAAWGYRF